MLQLPLTQYSTQGNLADAANVGMTTLDALFNGYRQHDESEMRYRALQDAEELLKQRKLETVPKQLEAMLAQAKMDPNSGYIKGNIDGYLGQMQSQIAAGKKAGATVDSEIGIANAQNKNKLTQEEMIARVNELKKQIVADASNPQSSGQGTINLPIAGKRGQVGIRNENNSPLQKMMPLRNCGVVPQNPEYEALQAAIADSTDLRHKLTLGDQKLDSQEALKLLQLQNMLSIAQARQSGGEKPPKTAEEALIRKIAAMEASGDLSHEEAQAERAKIFNRRTDKPQQPGIAAQTNQDGTINLTNKKPQDAYVPNTGKGKKPQGTGTKDDPIKLD